MKKLIAIVTIAIVLVGAVFATANDVNQSATVTITTCVERVLPTFKLVAANSTFAGETAPAAVATDAATDTADSPLGGAEYDATSTDISINDLEVFFGIYQTNQANVREEYELTVSANPLALMNEAGTAALTGNDAHSINPTDTTPAIAKATIASTVTGYTLIALDDSTDPKLTVAYTGKVGTASTDLLLGTFSVKWEKDVEAPSGTYKADVVLSITTV